MLNKVVKGYKIISSIRIDGFSIKRKLLSICSLLCMIWANQDRSSWTCLKHLTYEAPRRHPIQMPKPPTLALSTWRKVTICEGRNVARQLCFTLSSPFTTTDRNSIRITADTVPISLFVPLSPSLTREEDPEILKLFGAAIPSEEWGNHLQLKILYHFLLCS